ncbi:MAG TPA: sigma 54-interacting transcriptional regulator [Gemmatimonadales bacterium]|nr:sigma 54-interacting transcriptional regulator [Gemmatimonadales bacterium]
MFQLLQPILGNSKAMARVLDLATRFARSRHPILILGQPGTGKTHLARHIHVESRRTGEFVPESAANIPEHLEQSHLSGHVRGAFTGAHEDRMGLVESAHLGTFFLDELGVASHRVQELLLQLLDVGTIRRVGEVRRRPVSVRFIAATNADLEQMIAERRFRRDLRDRFGYLTLEIPPLAERRDEILPLTDHFLHQELALLGQDERPVLSEEVRDCLMAAPWSGNIRELESVCRYAITHREGGGPITSDNLPAVFLATLGEVVTTRVSRRGPDRVQMAIAAANGNKSRAAKMLGMSRQQLYRVLETSAAVCSAQVGGL